MLTVSAQHCALMLRSRLGVPKGWIAPESVEKTAQLIKGRSVGLKSKRPMKQNKPTSNPVPSRSFIKSTKLATDWRTFFRSRIREQTQSSSFYHFSNELGCLHLFWPLMWEVRCKNWWFQLQTLGQVKCNSFGIRMLVRSTFDMI